jgi:hypothetical protein
MKILSLTFSMALCIGAFGCEMHPASKRTTNSEETPRASSEQQKTTQPEAVNPNPPSYFPTPKSS